MSFNEAIDKLYQLKEGDQISSDDITAIKVILNDPRVMFHSVSHEDNYNY